MIWLDNVKRQNENRGIMSSLKCLLYDNKRIRAWPTLQRLGIDIHDTLKSFIASLYAHHPMESNHKNFGESCYRIMKERSGPKSNNFSKDSDQKLDSLEKRFLLLLSSDTEEELFHRVLRMVLYAKSMNIGINYTSLYYDMKSWGSDIKTKWGSSFWNVQHDEEELE
jgi:CRISPR type I-E-associated protein CasB/Cse2